MTLAVILLYCMAACSPDTGARQQARGALAYATYCQACHEEEEGIGPRLTSAVLASHMTAAQLFAYHRDKMPYNAGGSLTEQQYWDITAYLLQRSGLSQGTRPLAAKSATYPLRLPSE